VATQRRLKKVTTGWNFCFSMPLLLTPVFLSCYYAETLRTAAAAAAAAATYDSVNVSIIWEDLTGSWSDRCLDDLWSSCTRVL
jgi:hypothetical protein